MLQLTLSVLSQCKLYADIKTCMIQSGLATVAHLSLPSPLLAVLTSMGVVYSPNMAQRLGAMDEAGSAMADTQLTPQSL